MRARPPSRAAGSLAAALAGLLLFGSAALLERIAGAGPAASGLVEEILKSLLVGGFAAFWSASAAPLAREHERREARADGLCLALVAVAVFAAAENVAYFAAFPDTGVLARLAWALPLHIGTAEILALGFLGRGSARGPAGAARRAARLAASFAAAAAWHAAANAYAANSPRGAAFAAPAFAFVAAAVALGAAFRRKAYIGGLLNGAQRG